MKWGRAALVVATVAASAAVIQQALTVRDRRRYPAPGMLVHVDGHQTHLQVLGAGVRWTDGSARSRNGLVLTELVLGPARACCNGPRLLMTVQGSAGPAQPRPRDAQTIAVELRDALREAGIEPPCVLAGHSFGGLPVRAFADLYPDLTAGLILVDASHPDQWVRWPTPHADRILEVSQRILGWLGWFGLLRALHHRAYGISAGLPARQASELRAGAALQVSPPPRPRRSAHGR